MPGRPWSAMYPSCRVTDMTDPLHAPARAHSPHYRCAPPQAAARMAGGGVAGRPSGWRRCCWWAWPSSASPSPSVSTWPRYGHHPDLPVLDPGRQLRTPGVQILIAIRGRCHHGHRCRVLHHDLGADAGLTTVRPPDDAHLHAGLLGNQLTLGIFVGSFRVYSVLSAGVHHDDRAHPVRAAPLHPRCPRRCCWSTSGVPDLFHPPHRQVDSAARGHRPHRRGSAHGHRHRVPRGGRTRGTWLTTAALGPRRPSLQQKLDTSGGRRCRPPPTVTAPVRGTGSVDRHRVAL